MRLSQFHLATVKEVPADAEIASHRLMLRAGMLRKLAAGIYTWTPLGLRVLRKVETVVREEMDRAGAIEMLMPSIQPRELWEETGRWEKFGGQLLKIRDRKDQEYCYGPTHEEVITDFARNELKSYKQLPVNFYQIQTKFRDEIRPRFGVMRAREFLMKDAYSFHLTPESLDETYQVMYQAYARSSRAWACASAPCRPTPAPSAAMPATSSRCWPSPARTPSPGATGPTTPPTWSWPRRVAAGTERPLPARRTGARGHALAQDHRRGRHLPVGVPGAVREDPPGARHRRPGRLVRARRSRDQRGQGRQAGRAARASRSSPTRPRS